MPSPKVVMTFSGSGPSIITLMITILMITTLVITTLIITTLIVSICGQWDGICGPVNQWGGMGMSTGDFVTRLNVDRLQWRHIFTWLVISVCVVKLTRYVAEVFLRSFFDMVSRGNTCEMGEDGFE